MSTIHRARVRTWLAIGAVPLVTVGLTAPSLASPTAQDADPPPALAHTQDVSAAPQAITQASASELAEAMSSPSVTVTGARFQTQADPATAGVGDSALTGFPTDGGTFAILSTGDVADIPVPGTHADTAFGVGPIRGGAYDTTILEIDLTVPAGANCLAVDTRILSDDTWLTYPSQDSLIVELDTSTWQLGLTTVPPFLPVIEAPDNVADRPDELANPGTPITPGVWSELGWSAENGAGTAFDGPPRTPPYGAATNQLVVQTPITAGDHTIHLSIFDHSGGDDTVAFLDNLRLAQVGNPTVDCAPGARPLAHQVELTPASGTAETGTEHAVTATVTDADGAAAAAGTSVEFTVSGAHSTTGTVATGADGTAVFAYTGDTAGADEVRACVRPGTGLPCSALGEASVTWTEPSPPPPGAERVSGEDRYGTAAAIAEAWGPGVDLVYVTSGHDFPDAVPAGALGGTHDAPVLLTEPGSIPSVTADALTRLAPQRIVVLGGEAAVAQTVVEQLGTYALADTPDEVSRLAGGDRYATAAAVADTYPVGVEVAYIASGLTFPDSVTGSSRAGAEDAPVLLTRQGSLPDSTIAALTRLQPGRIVILGGQAAVHDTVQTELESLTAGGVTRLAGVDRYGTATAIAGHHAPGVGTVFVASGAAYADSLAGAPLAASLDGPVLLTRPTSLPAVTAAELERLDPARIVVLGGTAAVSEEVRLALAAYLD